MNQKQSLQLSFLLLSLSVSLGAVGAHLLQKTLTIKGLETFETGARYLTYHSLGLLIISINKNIYENLAWTKSLLLFGIFFFCGNCFLYSLTNIKVFAMLVPIGGFSFIIGWIVAIFEIKKFK